MTWGIARAEQTRRMPLAVGVAVLLLVLAAQLVASIRLQSQTFDEGVHLYAGYRYWKSFDFGFNPEHPPLVKLVAAAPLLHLQLRLPPLQEGDFKVVEYGEGRAFLYSNDAFSLLFRARLATSLFTLALGLAIFLVANSLFGAGPALLALALFVFEPNFLAHGALVTTDVAASFGIFLSCSAYYSFLRKPSYLRLVGSGLAAGVCLAIKLSGILLLPIFVVLSLVILPGVTQSNSRFTGAQFVRVAVLRIATLAVIFAIALFLLWGTYGFRFAARPDHLSVTPDLQSFSRNLQPAAASGVLTAAHFRLLPESYLYGVADVFSPKLHPTTLFGRSYPSARWFFFPCVFLIKSTAAFLILFCLVPLSFTLLRKTRDFAFLFIPACIYAAAAVSSGMNFGIRHLLPCYPFLIILAAVAAWTVATRWRVAAALVALLFVAHAASSLRAYPDYLTYANELWGGPANAHNVVSDSNVDWGQGLIAMQRYIERNHTKNCWFAYFADFVSNTSYYGVPCKALPTAFGSLAGVPTPVVPPEVTGPVFLSASEVASTYWDGDLANPYCRFQKLRPSALIADSILVFEGKVDLHEAAALVHEQAAMQALNDGSKDRALQEADAAVAVAPETPFAHSARAVALSALRRTNEARVEMEKAQALAQELAAVGRVTAR